MNIINTDFAQKYAEIISNSFGVEVTIIDNNFTRIAGTGEFKLKVGEKIPDYFITSKVIKTGQNQVIYFNEDNTICEQCSQKCTCKEKGFICVALTDKEEILGAIGLICYDDEAIQLLIAKKENILNLISSIGELLVLKTKEEEYINKLELNNYQFESIFSSIEEGLIITNDNGVIINCSNSVAKILGISKNSIIGQTFGKLSDSDLSNYSFYNNIEYSEIKFKRKNKLFQFSSSPIMVNSKFCGSVIMLFEDSKINPLIYKKINDSQKITFENIIGKSIEITNAINMAMRASKVDSNLLIIGESGTGKELFARSVHNNGSRSKAPFISINCGAIPEALLESELFGYEGGAFTGASKSGKPGKFELANNGTIFLDEIGDMPLHLQVKLLRVIQENEIERIGSTTSIKINARLITATNKNLEELVDSKQFREDLYYRINVVQLRIPPLRERKDDIPLLVDHFMTNYCDKIGISKKTISKEAMDILCNYEWKGNIRELQNTIEYVCYICPENEVTEIDLGEKLKIDSKYRNDSEFNKMDSLERIEIIKALEKYGYTTEGKLQAAKSIGISRSTLYRKLKEYNIN